MSKDAHAEQHRIDEIKDYIRQLDIQIKSDNAKKRAAKEKKCREEIENRILHEIETVKKELEEDKKKKEVIKRDLQEVDNEVKQKQALMDEYARQIGFTNIQEKQYKLRVELNNPPITSCIHRENLYHSCEGYRYMRKCVLCGLVYEEDR